MNKISTILLDCYNGNIPAQFSAMSKEAREEAVRKELLNVMGLEKFEKSTFRKALRKPDVQVAIFEIIEEVVAENFKSDSEVMGRFAELFVDVRNIAAGDENLFTVFGKHDLIVSEYSGSHQTVRRQRFESGQSFSLEMRNFIIGVYVYLEQLLAGRQDLATFVMALNEAVAKKIRAMIVTAFEAGLTNLPNSYKVSGSYSAENIIAMLEKLEAVNGGVKPRLIGSTSAIRKLQNVSDLATKDLLSSNMKDTINARKTLPVWMGYECIELENSIKEGTIDELVLAPDKIYAVCGDEKIVKVVFEGEPLCKTNDGGDSFQNADLTIDYILSYKETKSLVC